MCLCAGRGTADGSNFKRLLQSAYDGGLDLAVLGSLEKDKSLTPQIAVKEVQHIWQQVRADKSSRVELREVLDLCSKLVLSAEGLRTYAAEQAGKLTQDMLNVVKAAEVGEIEEDEESAVDVSPTSVANQVLRQTLKLWTEAFQPPEKDRKGTALKREAQACVESFDAQLRVANCTSMERIQLFKAVPLLLSYHHRHSSDQMDSLTTMVRAAIAVDQLPHLILQAVPTSAEDEHAKQRFQTLARSVLRTIGSDFATHLRASRARAIGELPTMKERDRCA
jgi:hypothetical protein